jgi:trimeric autotransporter adhesin
VKYLKLIPAKITAPHAKATYSQAMYSWPRRITRSSGSSELYLYLEEKDNIYSDTYSNQSRTVQVDLSSPDRCEGAEDSCGENRSSNRKKKEPSEATTSAAVQYLSNDSDSDDNITTVSTTTHSQPARKLTGFLAERNRERIRVETQSKEIAAPSEPVLNCLPLPLSAVEMNDNSTPEECVTAGSQDSFGLFEDRDKVNGEAVEKRESDVEETAVQDPVPLNESMSSATVANSTIMEPQESSLSSARNVVMCYYNDPLPTAAAPAAKPVRKTPLPSSTCSSAESVTAKDVLSQSVSPSSRDKRHLSASASAHPITNSSSSKHVVISNTSHSSSSSSSSSSNSSSSSSSRKRSASDLAESNLTHSSTSTRAAARRKDKTDEAATSGLNGSSIHREKRPRQVKEKGSLVDLTDESGDREFT